MTSKKLPETFRIGKLLKVLEKITEKSQSAWNEAERIKKYDGLNEPAGIAKRAEFRTWEEARAIIEDEFNIGKYADQDEEEDSNGNDLKELYQRQEEV